MTYELGYIFRFWGKKATIISYVNDDDAADRRLQGCRYLIKLSNGQVYSVTDKEISTTPN